MVVAWVIVVSVAPIKVTIPAYYRNASTEMCAPVIAREIAGVPAIIFNPIGTRINLGDRLK